MGDFDASVFIEKLDKSDLEMYQKLNSDDSPSEDNRFKTIAKNRKVLLV